MTAEEEKTTTTTEQIEHGDEKFEGVLDLVEAAEEFVKAKFRTHDPSHDWHHVHRVRLMALNLTRCSTVHEPDMLVVELAALFHDLCDAKYAETQTEKRRTVTASTVLHDFFQPFLRANVLSQAQVDTVYRIVDSVSWSKEEARIERMQRERARGGEALASDIAQELFEQQSAEFRCVSDADRLDAIGSIGILRVAAFSAVKNRPLYIPPANAANDPVPPAEQASGYNGSAVAHFYEKLRKIRGERLKTDMARVEAERRQSIMASFLSELDLEWLVADQGAQLSLLQ